MQAFDVRLDAADGRVVVRPEGDLDLATARTLERALDTSSRRCQQVILDLRGLRFMDSEGLNTILRTSRRFATRGVVLRLVAGPSTVDRVFVLTNTKARLSFVDAIEVDAGVPQAHAD